MSEESIEDITEGEYLSQLEERMDDAFETFVLLRDVHQKIMYERQHYKLHFYKKYFVDEDGDDAVGLEYHRIGRKD